MENHHYLKWMLWGYPHFRKPSYINIGKHDSEALSQPLHRFLRRYAAMTCTGLQGQILQDQGFDFRTCTQQESIKICTNNNSYSTFPWYQLHPNIHPMIYHHLPNFSHHGPMKQVTSEALKLQLSVSAGPCNQMFWALLGTRSWRLDMGTIGNPKEKLTIGGFMSVTSIVQLNVTGVKDMIRLDPWLLVSRLKSYGLLNTAFASLALNGTLFSCIATSRLDKFWPVSAAVLRSNPSIFDQRIAIYSMNPCTTCICFHIAHLCKTFARRLVLDQRPVVSCTCSTRKFKSSRQPGPPNRWVCLKIVYP